MALQDSDLAKLVELLNQIDIRVQSRRRTTAAWASGNEVLLAGELGVETDGLKRAKRGNGTDGWNDLLFVDAGAIDLDGLVNGNTLVWDSTNSKWIAGIASGAAADAVSALTISSGTVNIDCSSGPYFTLSLTANVTSITFSNLPASGKAVTLMIRLRQDSTGSRTVALPSSFKKTTGSDNAVQAAANSYTTLAITTFDQGTRWEYTMTGSAA